MCQLQLTRLFEGQNNLDISINEKNSSFTILPHIKFMSGIYLHEHDKFTVYDIFESFITDVIISDYSAEYAYGRSIHSIIH